MGELAGPKGLTEGFAVGTCGFMKPWANSQRLLGFPRGEAGSLDGSSEPARLTEEGWRQPKYCLHLVQWYQLKIIAVYLSLFRIIYHIGEGIS